MSWAQGQLGVQDDPSSTYCNPYSGHWGDGSSSGCKAGSGYRNVEWCADFAAEAWQQAGANVPYGSASVDINASSASFYRWGVANGTWHAIGSGYTPQPGDVALYGTPSSASHVAVVVSNGSKGPNVINGDWEIDYPKAFPTAVAYEANETSADPGNLSGYVSPVSSGGGSLADGAFVSYGGNVYRIAGGAPIYVHSWSVFGGPQPVTPITDPSVWASLNAYPADGTFVAAGGFVYRIAGGAPVYVSNWSAVGGPHASIEIDPLSITNADAGGVWNHLHPYPADGTFVAAGGYVYRMAGGAPIYVSSWNAVGGAQPSVEIDPSAIANAGGGSPWNHLLPYPADGTFVAAGGDVYRIAGGAPMYVSSWSAVGGPQPSVEIDPSAIASAGIGFPWNHLRQYPTDGTFLTTIGGADYRIAGGAAIPIDTWSPYGGPQGATVIDQSAVDEAGGPVPWNHLAPKPIDGTVLEGLPSASFWKITGGLRSAVAPPEPSAVGIPDDALLTFPDSTPAPKITSFSPAQDGVGRTVTIAGSNLASASQVSFNGTIATTFHIVSGTRLTAEVPTGATSGSISLIASGGTTTSHGTFTVVPVPVVSSFGPASGTPGTALTITGSHFSGATSVTFNGTKAAFRLNSDTSIWTTVPPLATTGTLSVTTLGGTGASGSSFTVIPLPPSITGFSPAKGHIGAPVTIVGTNLSGVTAVKFNGVPAATFDSVTASKLTVIVPSGATSGKISVVTPGGTATSKASYAVS